MSARITTIIPAFNRPNFLQTALLSILNKSYDNHEVIVVDDHSDAPLQKQITLPASKINIRWISHKKNKGGAAARNSGIKHARTPFIAFLDDDDKWKPDYLECAVNTMDKLDETYGVVYGDTLFVDETNRILDICRLRYEGDFYKSLLKENFLAPPAMFFRRECFEDCGEFDEFLSLAIHLTPNSLKQCPEPWVIANFGEDLIMKQEELPAMVDRPVQLRSLKRIQRGLRLPP